MTLLQITQGNVVHCSCTFTDMDGTPTDPTTVLFEVQTPDGVWAEHEATAGGGPGAYDAEVAIPIARASAGTWRARWTGTGAVVASSDSEWLVLPRL